MAEFGRLREDVQKLGLAAKAAGQRKVNREEMCKHITAYSAAELKWVKYTDANVKTCGIPAEVAQQLKQVHSNTEQTKEKICSLAAARRGGDYERHPHHCGLDRLHLGHDVHTERPERRF